MKKKLKSSRVLIIIFAAIILCVILIKMRTAPKRNKVVDTGLPVEVFQAQSQDLDMIIETYGTVKPRESLKLIAEVRGRIINMNDFYREGLFVKKGDILLEIDPRTYDLEVQRCRVQINQTIAEINKIKQEIENLNASKKITVSDVKLAKAEYKRLKKLSHKRVIAQTTIDVSEQKYLASLERLQSLKNRIALTGPQMQQVKTQKDMAQVRLKQAELDRERAKIVSPFGGWVSDKPVEKGQHVTHGQYLGQIYRSGAFDVEVRIPIRDMKWLEPYDSKKIMPDADIVFNNQKWKGRVARIKANMDEKTRTLPVVVEINDSRQNQIVHLRAGMFVNVFIKGTKIKNAYKIPRYVIRADDTIYIAEQDKMRIKKVNIIRTFKDFVYIDKGINTDDFIIKTIFSSGFDGMKIKIKES